MFNELSLGDISHPKITHFVYQLHWKLFCQFLKQKERNCEKINREQFINLGRFHIRRQNYLKSVLLSAEQ